jgi:hypothetical protein
VAKYEKKQPAGRKTDTADSNDVVVAAVVLGDGADDVAEKDDVARDGAEMDGADTVRLMVC